LKRNKQYAAFHPWVFALAIFAALLAASVLRTHAQVSPPTALADVIVEHGKIYTENPAHPWAEAVAATGEKILAVGDNLQIAKFRGPKTQIIDAHGRVVLPGFTDSHIHFLEGSISLDQVDLNGAKTIPEIQKKLRDYATTHQSSPWILGQGWSYDVFPPTGMPDKKILDEVFPDRPVYLESYDSHSAWANSKALQLAGVTRDTPDPLDGLIVRDPQTHEATGALKENATNIISRATPKPTREEKLAAYRNGLALAAKNGLVRAHSAGGDFDDLDLLDALRQSGQLTLRFYVAKKIQPPALLPEDVSSILAARAKYHDDWIAAGAAKFFMDGVVESHTAAMLAPYSDDPAVSGAPNWQAEKYDAAVAELDRNNIQIFTHAIGDRAVRMALDAYQQAETKNDHTDSRDRIEHIETISPQDIQRFSALGVIASMQPLHAYPDEDTGVWVHNVGLERQKYAFAWNSLLQAGAHLAFGSDWEIVTLNPWPGVQCAVTRQTEEGTPADGWIPEERITVAQAIHAYTLGAAYSSHREKTEGSIEPGKLADLIIVSQNPFQVAPSTLGKTEVLTTIVGGHVVYQSKDNEAEGAKE
jgi:predicted amidohydrolase YtcJ